MQKLRARRPRLTYSDVVATLALFLALGGGAYAAIDLVGRNDIKSKHIARHQVKPRDVAVPQKFKSAGLVVTTGLGDCTGATNEWVAVGTQAGYYRDHEGRVYLEGFVAPCGEASDLVFTLPPGYRPKVGHDQLVGGGNIQGQGVNLHVGPNGDVEVVGVELGFGASLDGVSFRCASGTGGCP
jgi:hypothetical protein